MWIHYFENVLIVLFILSLFVMIYMIFCRDSHHFRGLDKEMDRHFVNAFVNRLYFVVTTFTTIGYGDITPLSLRCRIITIFILLTVFIAVLKFFDSFIDTYNVNYHQYVNSWILPTATANANKQVIQ